MFSHQQLVQFAQRVPREMALLRAVGLDPQDICPLTNLYTGEVDSADYRNICIRCLAVGYWCARLADLLVDIGAIRQEVRDRIVTRGVLHDALKVPEIWRRDAQRAGIAIDAYGASAYDAVAPLLRERGVLSAESTEYLVHAGKETGHVSLALFLTAQLDGSYAYAPQPLEVALPHLADDQTFTSLPREAVADVEIRYLRCAERMARSDFPTRYPWLWKKGLAVNRQGTIVEVEDLALPGEGLVGIGSYGDLQPWIAEQTARNIAARFGFSGDDAEGFLLSKLG